MHKLLVWPLHCKSWWECYAYCLQLIARAGQVDSIKMEAIGLIQLHIAITVKEVYCLFFTYYHQTVEWRPPCISLVYILGNMPYIAYSLRIKTPTVPHLSGGQWLQFYDVQYRNLLGEVMELCLYFRYLVSQLLHIVPSPRHMIYIASEQYSRTIFRFGVPKAIPLFSYNHSPIVLFYIEGLHHDHVISWIISQVNNMSFLCCDGATILIHITEIG
jgi:hypothetical protein